MNVSALDDPRVTARVPRVSLENVLTQTVYDVDVAPPADVSPPHNGYLVLEVVEGWSSTWPAGWVVFNSYGVWIGKTDHPLVDNEHEIDACGIYSDAESAVAAVLTATRRP